MIGRLKNFGISNTNSNCWLSALMQALLSCDEFIKWMGRKAQTQPDNVVVLEVARMLVAGDGVFVFSSAFMNAMSAFDPTSATKCADEAMLFLFSQFGNALDAENQRLFGIKHKSLRPCECGFTGEVISILPFVQLYADVAGDLGAWIMGEKTTLAHGRICDKCKRETALPMTDNVVGLRVILPIITGGHAANFTEFITVGDFQYRLIASIEYSCGHYYVICWRNGTRILFNDEHVMQYPRSLVAPYVVIYSI